MSECLCDIYLTDPYCFVPAFVELTSSNLEENRRLIIERGITFPLGMLRYNAAELCLVPLIAVLLFCLIGCICELFNVLVL